MRWGFARWVSEAPTGGNAYDDRLTAGLLASGVDLQEYRVDGTWPRGGTDGRRQLAQLLTVERNWLIDAIVAFGAPDVIAAAVSAGRRVVLMVHSFMSDESWSSPAEFARFEAAERTALSDATAVICTSEWSAHEVTRRCGRADVGVARPGMDPAPLAGGSRNPPRILSLGTVCERKDQLTLVGALADLQDLRWSARIVGATDIEPEYADAVRAEIGRRGIRDRMYLVGPQQGADLERQWAATDLLVLTSRAETYGMVVVEALARGIPSVVTAGTGAVEAQAVGGAIAGAVVRPADRAELAAVLRTWITDPQLRRRWRDTALQSRSRIPSWDHTAQTVAAQLDAVGSM